MHFVRDHCTRSKFGCPSLPQETTYGHKICICSKNYSVLPDPIFSSLSYIVYDKLRVKFWKRIKIAKFVKFGDP